MIAWPWLLVLYSEAPIYSFGKPPLERSRKAKILERQFYAAVAVAIAEVMAVTVAEVVAVAVAVAGPCRRGGWCTVSCPPRWQT